MSLLRLLERRADGGDPAEALMGEIEALAGCRAALYVVDLEGTTLRRAAGWTAPPAEVALRQGVGPELARLDCEVPGAVAVPLRLGARALGVLALERRPSGSLDDLATMAGAAVELAEGYTDAFARARRARPTSAAAEVQQNLLPHRIAAVPGAELVATVVPAYEVGGDWFDHAADGTGAWLAVADAVGKGSGAAAIAAVTLGAYRAARRSGDDMAGAVRSIHTAVAEISGETLYTTAVLGRWEADTATFAWIRCGHPPPILLQADGRLEQLHGSDTGLLGLAELPPSPQVVSRALRVGERLVLLSDGVTERRRHDGRAFGLDGVRQVLLDVPDASAAETVAAITSAVRAVGDDLRDDATVVVLRPR